MRVRGAVCKVRCLTFLMTRWHASPMAIRPALADEKMKKAVTEPFMRAVLYSILFLMLVLLIEYRPDRANLNSGLYLGIDRIFSFIS